MRFGPESSGKGGQQLIDVVPLEEQQNNRHGSFIPWFPLLANSYRIGMLECFDPPSRTGLLDRTRVCARDSCCSSGGPGDHHKKLSSAHP